MTAFSFDAVAAILLIPVGAAALLATLPNYRITARLNVAASFLTLLAALSLLVTDRPEPGQYMLVDDLNIVFIVLNTFVGFTTSVFSASYIAHELETGRLTATNLRFYHAMYQIMMFGMNLAFVSNNIGLMWVAVELATLTTVLMVGIYRTHEALEAAWKYFILGSVGIALALFGTILVYMAAQPVVGEGTNAMVWTVLIEQAARFDPALLNVAFVFLLLGYGTKVGLAPLHAWLPDAHAEGPTPISAVLSGLLLNVALYAVLRFKLLLAASPDAIAPGPLMVTMGLTSLVFAAFMLYRRRDIKRLFAYSSIEHMGIIVFAFGMGGPLANFAGLLHMVMHSLTKSAIFFAVGHIAQVKGTQKLADIQRADGKPSWARLGAGHRRRRHRRPPATRHLHERIPGRKLDICKTAASGDPIGFRAPARFRRPAAAADRCRLRRTARQHSAGRGILRADVLPSGAGVCCRHLSAATSRHMVPACRGDSRMKQMKRKKHAGAGRPHPGRPSRRASRSLGTRRDDSENLELAVEQLADGRLSLLGLWGEPGAVHMALLEEGAGNIGVVSLKCPVAAIRRLAGCIRRPCASSARQRTCSDCCRKDCQIRVRGSITANGASVIHWVPASRPQRRHRPIVSWPPRARACTRSRSGQCTPASSSQDIFGLRQAAKRSFGWRSVLGTRTRA